MGVQAVGGGGGNVSKGDPAGEAAWCSCTNQTSVSARCGS
jgi:hypothetical protein